MNQGKEEEMQDYTVRSTEPSPSFITLQNTFLIH